ncbi:MAG: hypothetical protein FWE89_01760, partial [Syntrophaceae bacterium]|nr:hypothetical protein [Syntrophaceae bacterium]
GTALKRLGESGSCVGVFLPHALAPMTGVYVLVPHDQAWEIPLTVEEALKFIISAGIVTPQES